MLKGMMKIFAVVAFSFGLVFPATFVVAQEASSAPACECFCNTAKGAISADQVAGADACRGACKEINRGDDYPGARFLGCFTEDQEDNLPENNKMCWSALACAADLRNVEDKDGPQPSIWGGQENFCKTGEGYCYNPAGYIADFGCNEKNPLCASTKVTLGVPIGNLEKAANLGEYVQAIYNFLLGAGALIAIVMIMIAGVEWMTARGRDTQIKKAKDRIGSAVLGLTILFFAVTIGTLLDPSVVRFKSLGVPKIRRVDYIDISKGCKALGEREDYKIVIEKPGPETCGNEGSIQSITDKFGESHKSVEGIEVGDTCRYFECLNDKGDVKKDASCLRESSTGRFSCAVCKDIFPSNPLGIEPAPGVCAVMSVGEGTDGKGGDFLHQCYFSADASVVAGKVTNVDSAINDRAFGLYGETGTCVTQFTYCPEIENCSDYGERTFVAGGGDLTTAISENGYFPWNYVPSLGSGLGGDEGDIKTLDGGSRYQLLCLSDPCKKGACKFDTKTLKCSNK